MSELDIEVPVVGLPDSSEEPKVASALTALSTWANGQIDLDNLSAALQALIAPDPWVTYTPTWHAVTTPPVLGNGTLAASYAQFGATCAFNINLTMGSTSTGGAGAISFDLPVAAVGGIEQEVLCKLFISVDLLNPQRMGFGYIPPTSGTVVFPFFPLGPTSSSLNQLSNSSNGTPATGNPLVQGSYPLTTGSNLIINGVYQTA